jgi:hypothetical protein
VSTLWEGKSNSLLSAATQGNLSPASYKVTEDFVFIETGILSSQAEQIPMWAIRDCDVNQSIIQKARNVSNLRIVCEHNDFTGKKQFILENIEGAKELRDILNKHSKEARITYETQQKAQTVSYSGFHPAAPSSSQDSGDDVVHKLEKLSLLLEKGLLTPEEFQSQKARILGA